MRILIYDQQDLKGDTYIFIPENSLEYTFCTVCSI